MLLRSTSIARQIGGEGAAISRGTVSASILATGLIATASKGRLAMSITGQSSRGSAALFLAAAASAAGAARSARRRRRGEKRHKGPET